MNKTHSLHARERDRERERERQPAHPPRRQEAGGGERGKRGPRAGTPTKLQTGSQFLTKDFRRFWMFDIRQEGRG